MSQQRENFTSKMGAVLAMAGSAVGLGNIWRFPNVVGQNGGAAFIIIYILCLLVICIPTMIAEISIGRRSQSNALRAFRRLAPGSKAWKYAGLIYIIVPTIILSYYCVIGGWTCKYLLDSFGMRFSDFGGFVSSDIAPLVFMGIFLIVTCVIVMLGVTKGIEGFSKIMMPVLFLVMIVIAVRSMTLEGASKGITYLFKPDFTKVTPAVVQAALGQAFFSLSLGAGSLLIYGSYVRKEENLLTSASMIAFFDLIFALIAGCAVLPAVFAFGMDVQEGTGLVFETLPTVFAQMPMGSVVAVFFFFALVLAALTTSISQFEVPVSYLVEERHMSRKAASVIVFVVAFAVGTLCSLSFGSLSGVHIAGRSIFDALDHLAANYLMPIGGMIAVIFVAWYLGKDIFHDELGISEGSRAGRMVASVVFGLIKYVAPVAIVIIFICGLI